MEQNPPKTPDIIPVQHFDKDGQALAVGDHVGFIMRGWYLIREQESFGIIESIDDHGGIRIQVRENYKCFSKTKRLITRVASVYFTHHKYDPEQKARIYSVLNPDVHYFIFKI